MEPIKASEHITSFCPHCKKAANFTFRDFGQHGPREYGYIIDDGAHRYEDADFGRIIYTFYACVVCKHPGVAKWHANNNFLEGKREWFWPSGMEASALPDVTPADLVAEFREAERVTSVNAWRAAAALLRSTLEKCLKANGYTNRQLFENIEDAKKDGLITAARAKSAHDVVRTLGNDVLHDTWRVVTDVEVVESFMFVQRILEDFYLGRAAVETALIAANRLAKPNP